MHNGMTFKKPAAHRAIARILDFLAQRPATNIEIAEHVPLALKHCNRYLTWLHSQEAIHVARWVRDEAHGQRAYPRRVWADGPGRDARRPAPKTRADTVRDMRDRQREADPIGYYARRRAKALLKRSPRRDVAAAWIGGQA